MLLLDTFHENIDKSEANTLDEIRAVVKKKDKLLESKFSWLDMLRKEDAQNDESTPFHFEANMLILALQHSGYG